MCKAIKTRRKRKQNRIPAKFRLRLSCLDDLYLRQMKEIVSIYSQRFASFIEYVNKELVSDVRINF